MTWRNPLAFLGRVCQGHKEKDPVRSLVSNLPYEHLKKKERPNRRFKGNAISTTKYNLWSFIPLNLFEQFHRLANIYFVGLAVLNFVPVVNAFQPEVALIPICIILALTAIKDGWEDFRRYQSDRKLNNMPCLIFSRQMGFVERRWKDVRVGDFVKVLSNEIIPADILLLHTSDPNGVCHVETAGLDGETNLKQRKVVPRLSDRNVPFEPQNFNCAVVCEQPNDNLNHFKGYVEKPSGKKVGFGIESLLLRGCIVRNTDESSGIVVYTGHETKSMLNNNGPGYKRSKMERKINTDVLYCVLLLFSMCLIGALGHSIWLETFSNVPLYFAPNSDGQYTPSALAGLYMFFTMIILLQVMIPISLYVSIELVKIGQVCFISQDIDLYDEELDSRAQCRALNITEDLGQIEYVFSDKTGTLTENKMVFRRCSIMGTEYSHEENAIRLAVAGGLKNHEEVTVFQQQKVLPLFSLDLVEDIQLEGSGYHGSQAGAVGPRRHKSPAGAHSNLAFSSPLETEVAPDRKLLRLIWEADHQMAGGRGLQSELHLDFFLGLAICNTVVVSTATAQRQRGKVRHNSKSQLDHLKGLFGRTGSLRKIFSGLKSLKRKKTLSDPFAMDEEGLDSYENASISSGFDNPEPSLSTVGKVNGCTGGAVSGSAHGQGAQARPDEVFYEAQSPDEAALVHAAKAYGFTLLERTPNHVTVRLPYDLVLQFEVLDVLTFDHTRKRMSVLVRHPQTREVVLYTKGADSAIMELLEPPLAVKDKKRSQVAINTQKHLDMYARDGLRTLCFAKKTVSEEEYKNWSIVRQDAMSAIDEKEKHLMDTAISMETNLTILGATGIEDRLQENVPETIQALREAGIQVWVLTGDKPETAVNIAYSCKLLDQNDLVFTLNKHNKAACKSKLDSTLELLQGYGADPRSRSYSRGSVSMATEPTIGLIIDGPTLSLALEEDLQDRFVELCKRCRSVLCCRVTPLQKSAVVKLVRDKLKVMTLAIGDGANDVNMIQAADVGIGISGQEGMQAVMASDFAIARFKHLKKMLLVHGHWCYTRLANMVIYFFYKNVAYVNLLFWYQFFCGFSGTAMIDYWLMIFFNLLFTSAPPVMFGIMDKDVSAEMLLGLPELYKSGQHPEGYRRSTFWLAILDAFYQSLVCFFVPYLTYQASDVDIFTFGTPMNTASLFTIILHLAIEIQCWTVVHWVIMVGSVGVFFIVTLVYSAMCISCNPPSDPYWIMQQQMTDPMFYLVCILTTVVALLPRYTVHALRGTLVPSSHLRARQLDCLSPALKEKLLNQWRNQGEESIAGLASSVSPPLSPHEGHSS